MARKTHPSPGTFALQGDLDVFSIQAQWERLQARAIPPGDPFVLDLSAVGDLDLSGLQLLLVLDRHLAARGIPLTVAGAKPEWQDRFRPLGLAGILGDRP
ncbi:hypothetical protein GETHPA_06720 [Geothrix rubra]|uniref:STAS domain-containing protein n=1 Tax=Geothrix rubra TaxID=2927977 RepID=A0ABQ5Q3R6_9BACT|nr:STAS domain-containing protein [Geothrix rubra]GLH69139.1 hypothetical protein GETHPA_06720 [Geothrix rubra]